MKSIFFALSILAVTSSFADETTEQPAKYGQVQLKLYNTLSVANNMTKSTAFPYFVYTSVYSLNILQPSFAANFKNQRGNRHEVELVALNIRSHNTKTIHAAPQHSTNGSEVIETNIAIGYEYIINFNKKLNARFVPGIGFGISPYFTRYNYNPYITSSFPVQQTYIGANTYITPRITLNAHKRVFFDINAPLNMTDIYVDIHKENNPTLSAEQQTVTASNIQAIPRYFSLRLGVGVNL